MFSVPTKLRKAKREVTKTKTTTGTIERNRHKKDTTSIYLDLLEELVPDVVINKQDVMIGRTRSQKPPPGGHYPSDDKSMCGEEQIEKKLTISRYVLLNKLYICH